MRYLSLRRVCVGRLKKFKGHKSEYHFPLSSEVAYLKYIFYIGLNLFLKVNKCYPFTWMEY